GNFSAAGVHLCPMDGSQRLFESTGPTGRYAIKIPSAGTFLLSAGMGGVGSAAMGPLTLDPSHDTEAPDLVLRGEGFLEGKAAYPDGSPAGFLTVQASLLAGEAPPSQEQHCDQEGL